ncbi:MAG: Holliday junction resolvase RuvX [Pyrinomonadaceae bacterium]
MNQMLVNSSADTPTGRLLALDLGVKRVGVAVSDELRITVRPLELIARTSWKQLLCDVAQRIAQFDACALVIGLPLHLNGTESEAACEARRIAHNFSRSLSIPVYLQDERLTSLEAVGNLRDLGFDKEARRERIDGEAAAIILRDFIAASGRASITIVADAGIVDS